MFSFGNRNMVCWKEGCRKPVGYDCIKNGTSKPAGESGRQTCEDVTCKPADGIFLLSKMCIRDRYESSKTAFKFYSL